MKARLSMIIRLIRNIFQSMVWLNSMLLLSNSSLARIALPLRMEELSLLKLFQEQVHWESVLNSLLNSTIVKSSLAILPGVITMISSRVLVWTSSNIVTIILRICLLISMVCSLISLWLSQALSFCCTLVLITPPVLIWLKINGRDLLVFSSKTDYSPSSILLTKVSLQVT